MLHLAICIPARDEAARLPTLFAALDRLEAGADTLVHVCLLLDACTDASGALAAAYAARSRHHVAVEHASSGGNVGLARHRAMLMGLARVDATDGLLLATDADSAPAPGWPRAMENALALADVVAGRIVRRGNRASPLQDRVEAYYDALFALRRRLDPVSWEAMVTHHCGGGANLGIRAGAYRAIGGFAPLTSGEDARLLDDAARAGLRVRRDAACVVATSDRRTGRAAAGLASSLRHLDEAEVDAVLVAHPQDCAWQYRLHAAVRDAWLNDRLDRIAAALSLALDHVRGVARDCPNGEALAMRIVPVVPGGMRQVPLPVAEAALATLTERRQAA